MQDYAIFSVSALEISQSYNKPSIFGTDMHIWRIQVQI